MPCQVRVPAKRLAAEEQILAHGAPALGMLGDWRRSSDPWLAMRAGDLWVRMAYGLDPGTEEKDMRMLRDLARLQDDALQAVISNLGQQSTWLPLAVLHDQLSTRKGDDSAYSGCLCGAVGMDGSK